MWIGQAASSFSIQVPLQTTTRWAAFSPYSLPSEPELWKKAGVGRIDPILGTKCPQGIASVWTYPLGFIHSAWLFGYCLHRGKDTAQEKLEQSQGRVPSFLGPKGRSLKSLSPLNREPTNVHIFIYLSSYQLCHTLDSEEF